MLLVSIFTIFGRDVSNVEYETLESRAIISQ